MSHHIVEAIGLSFAYPDGTHALDGVSFRIEHGESVAVVGANGAGKSTLLQHLDGCLVPKAGTVRVGDFPISKATLAAVRRSAWCSRIPTISCSCPRCSTTWRSVP